MHPKNTDGMANNVAPDQTAGFAQTCLPKNFRWLRNAKQSNMIQESLCSAILGN